MIKNYKSAVSNIQNELNNYLITGKLSALIVGISGGIDSALTAALAAPVCKELNIPLIGRSITIETNKKDEIERSIQIGKHFCNDFKEVNLTENYKLLTKMIFTEEEDKSNYLFKIRQGNVKARTRMIYLYDLAAKHKGMVLSTDNYTELLLGFWTLHGDVGDYGMIQNLWKTEVYEMSNYLVSNIDNKVAANALDSCIKAVPTDGLGITNSDLDQIQAKSYAEVDQIFLKLIYQAADIKDYENHPVIQRKLKSEFKRNNPYNIPRNKITTEPY